MGKIFGTDGARGIANTELTLELSVKIGRAAAIVLAGDECSRPKILIGKDTRASGDMIESALIAGLCSVGADVVLTGVVPTPAVAYLVKKYGCNAGIMISASHNPCEYNGIKLFSGDGFKLPDDIENRIEDIILDQSYTHPFPVGGDIGRVYDIKDEALADYIEHIISTTDCRFDGMKIALDCANGSASDSAKVIFEMLGADVTVLSNHPDGVNINDNCGSTHMENLIETVKEGNFDCGFAFDGDADRCLAVDENGNLVDGDRLIAICSKDLKERKKLFSNKAVVTVMSNLGFFHFAADNQIDTVITKVGDRYVLDEMVRCGYSIGGEQSGHIIFIDYATTGDGQLSAVQTLSVIKRTGKKMSELASVMDVYPQILVNIIVSNDKKSLLDTDDSIASVIEHVEKELGDNGRVLVRASGTEPLVRVMLEGKDEKVICDFAHEIAEVIADKLGGKIKS